MAKEIILHLDPVQTGLTVVARLFANETQTGLDIPLTEGAILGIYFGDMPSVAANVYAVRFIDTNTDELLALGEITWNGTKEITDLDMDLVRKLIGNRYNITSTQLIIYEDDGTTPLATFNLESNPSAADSSGGRTTV